VSTSTALSEESSDAETNGTRFLRTQSSVERRASYLRKYRSTAGSMERSDSIPVDRCRVTRSEGQEGTRDRSLLSAWRTDRPSSCTSTTKSCARSGTRYIRSRLRALFRHAVEVDTLTSPYRSAPGTYRADADPNAIVLGKRQRRQSGISAEGIPKRCRPAKPSNSLARVRYKLLRTMPLSQLRSWSEQRDARLSASPPAIRKSRHRWLR